MMGTCASDNDEDQLSEVSGGQAKKKKAEGRMEKMTTKRREEKRNPQAIPAGEHLLNCGVFTLTRRRMTPTRFRRITLTSGWENLTWVETNNINLFPTKNQ